MSKLTVELPSRLTRKAEEDDEAEKVLIREQAPFATWYLTRELGGKKTRKLSRMLLVGDQGDLQKCRKERPECPKDARVSALRTFKNKKKYTVYSLPICEHEEVSIEGTYAVLEDTFLEFLKMPRKPAFKKRLIIVVGDRRTHALPSQYLDCALHGDAKFWTCNNPEEKNPEHLLVGHVALRSFRSHIVAVAVQLFKCNGHLDFDAVCEESLKEVVQPSDPLSQDAILATIVVNPEGKPGKTVAADELLELYSMDDSLDVKSKANSTHTRKDVGESSSKINSADFVFSMAHKLVSEGLAAHLPGRDDVAGRYKSGFAAVGDDEDLLNGDSSADERLDTRTPKRGEELIGAEDEVWYDIEADKDSILVN
ncbi:uncharacterized protein MYCFIDRAFT_200746 [Pseudocercospora fijiensis CIRAD86]|uniref:DUF6589 domain-containing protein n=1 Tax=Pseudocercospora fijiensis (strain CIRAD86) TaxID=383855 RepID=M2YHA4_PSEFD|nr:uncharacterized protein MYCFIDRAFT_200746 [Pseudocercospora fijiensis CIRAD86]EME77210.1 hypothetical protein MYCFIDRAFT_200746 [Pseudocercospora fijiensis CIRAD86]